MYLSKKSAVRYFTDSASKSVFKLSWDSAGSDTYSGHLHLIRDGKIESFDFQSSGWDIDLSIPLDAANLMEKVLRESHGDRSETILAEIVKSQARSLDIMDVLKGITKVVDYGAASGLEITYKGKQFRLRPKPDEFLSPKPFQIWLLSEFGDYFYVPDKSELWVTFMTVISRLAEKVSAFSDDLAPPVLDELIRSIQRNDIKDQFDEDSFIDLEKSGIRHFFLIEDALFVHHKIYEDIMEQYELTRRKMRQFFEPYFIEQNTKQIHQFGQHPRFWLLNWKKMAADFPELADLLIKDYDRKCSQCHETIKGTLDEQTEFVKQHCELHGLEYPVYKGEEKPELIDAWVKSSLSEFESKYFPTQNEVLKIQIEEGWSA